MHGSMNVKLKVKYYYVMREALLPELTRLHDIASA